jgi:hypothetical protein
LESNKLAIEIVHFKAHDRLVMEAKDAKVFEVTLENRTGFQTFVLKYL